MPRFQSISDLCRDAATTAKRFPMVLVFAAIGTCAMIRFTNFNHDVQRELVSLTNLAMIAALGITSFLSLRVFAETHGWARRRELLWSLALTAVLAAYYWILPEKLKWIDLNRYGLINANAHLLVAIAPFLFLSKCTNAFWQYNKALFIRIILAFIYSNTIYVGLIIAVGVTDHLFEFITFSDRTYAHLWFIIVGLFNTWFFLKGVPNNILGLEEEKDYPRGLRVFTQFVLIPLVVLYLAILYLYMAKIVGTWELPKGWLSSFIIGVSIMGIVTLLLVHPLRESEAFGWIRTYSKYFYLALFPLIVLMAVAIGRRIADYGITEQRYFVLLFTVWLLVVALRFTFRPKADIRFIPLTLFVLVIVATWGPLSAMAVAKRSQLGRLEMLLEKNGLLVNGVIKKAAAPVEVKVNQEIGNIIAYLDASFGLRDLEKWAPPEQTVYWRDTPANRFVTDELGLEYTGYYYRGSAYDPSMASLYWSARHEPVIDVAGYQYYTQIQLYNLNNRVHNTGQTVKTPLGEATLSYDPESGALSFSVQGQQLTLVTLDAAWLKEMRRRFGLNGHNIDPEALTFSGANETLRVSVRVTNMNVQIPGPADAPPEVNSLYGHLLFSVQ